jgi:hypothetical protein
MHRLGMNTDPEVVASGYLTNLVVTKGEDADAPMTLELTLCPSIRSDGDGSRLIFNGVRDLRST